MNFLYHENHQSLNFLKRNYICVVYIIEAQKRDVDKMKEIWCTTHFTMYIGSYLSAFKVTWR